MDPADYDNRFDKDFEPIKCCAIGWLIKKTKSCIRLVWLLDQMDGPYAGIAIPNGSIINIQHLQITERSKPRIIVISSKPLKNFQESFRL